MTVKGGGALMPLLLLSGCNASSDAESGQSGETELSGRIDCALEGAPDFARNCTLDEMNGADGTVLVVGRADSGYRRLAIATDGRGVVAADGSEPAKVTVIGDGMIEVAVGKDRYRLPANTGGAN
ncbi:hypothetical protein [Sphingopyxis indica]|uniref:Lipoprotein n=1 Tax=Sphingopyxis indica TaxID=436663 RepID=A0A239DUM6_9SPHN|nr:hypothetical protein [Sphingopyxis indica]SNS35274.1 hypothetical protein SAMN06295955_101415 [Sphingopyxis indica]